MEDGSFNIVSFVIIGIAVMLVLIISFLLAFNFSQRKKFQYQQQMLQLKGEQQNELIKAAVRSEETERHRISEELHDEVGALLSATKLYLSHIKAEALKDSNKELYVKSLELLDVSIDKVRSISHNLHSVILKELGLNEAIESFIQKIAHGNSLNATVELDSRYITKNPENNISIYRIIQELCNNIIKHAHASEINIQSTLDNNMLIFTIKHNGKGLNQNEFEKLRYQKNGLGLKNIQNRIILLRGQINFESKPEYNSIVLEVAIKNAA